MTEPIKTTPKTTTQVDDIRNLLRARTPLIWVVSREEARVEASLFAAAIAANYVPRGWDCGKGVTNTNGKVIIADTQDPDAALLAIERAATSGNEPGVWVMRGLDDFISGPAGAMTRRRLKNLVRLLPEIAERDRAQAIIVLTDSKDVPPALVDHVTVVEWKLPTRDDIARLLDAMIQSLPEELREPALPAESRDAAIDAAVGLSEAEARACYSRSLVRTRTIDPVRVAAEKKNIIAGNKVLTWIEPLSGGLDSVGGLDVLKSWLTTRKAAYTPEARAYGLPRPKGVLLVGVSGCGKSLTAKAVATAWGVPLIEMDLGAAKGKFVGDSEATLRAALKTVDALGRCVLWIDEVEKVLAGATQGAADGGVSADALSTVLMWMQERSNDAFVIATSNDISALPPEFYRKGRFDELFFVDLPTRSERADIVIAALTANGRRNADVDFVSVADATIGFTGAEIAALVPEAMFAAFADGKREICTKDLIAAANATVPLSKTAAAKIDALRAWSKGRARSATTPEDEAPITRGVKLDLA